MAKQLKKFCRITKYIEKTDPKLYEILEDLCVMGAFRPRRGHNGTTFLWPSNETKSKLDKMRYTDDIDKGLDIVLAHIIHDYLPTAAAWTAKKSDIPTGGNKKLEVKSVTGSRIVLADGAELEHDAKFRTFSTSDENQAVWRVVKGSVDHTKHTKAASFEHAKIATQGMHKKPDFTERRSGPSKLTALGGSIAASILGGGTASAPFGFLVAFYEYVKAKDCEKSLNELKLIYDPNMITTVAFTTRGEGCVGEHLEAFTACQEEQDKIELQGSTKYFDIIKANHKEMGKSGGGKFEQLEVVLAQMIESCDKASKTALESVGALDPTFTSQVFTALNLSRAMEYAAMSSIPDDQRLRDDKVAEVRDIVEVIHGRATGCKSIETDPKSQNLGQLIASLLMHLKKFQNGPYAVYPFGKTGDAYHLAEKLCIKLYGKDKSIAGVLSKMSPDQLSDLFSNIGEKD